MGLLVVSCFKGDQSRRVFSELIAKALRFAVDLFSSSTRFCCTRSVITPAIGMNSSIPTTVIMKGVFFRTFIGSGAA